MTPSRESAPLCEACGSREGLAEHPREPGVWFCRSLQQCDYNQNIGWINADIQAGIDAAMQEMHGR